MRSSERVNEGDILIVPTDKSGRLSVTTKEAYVEAMQPHVTSDNIIDLEEEADIERKLNRHTLQLGRILMLGEDHDHCTLGIDAYFPNVHCWAGKMPLSVGLVPLGVYKVVYKISAQ
jgi:hypothetical protein